MSIVKFDKRMLGSGNIQVRCKQGRTSYKNHWHEYFEMIYYHGCNGSCTVNGEVLPIYDECVFLVTPTDFHSIDTEEDRASGYILVGFSEDTVSDKLFRAGGLVPSALDNPSEFVRSAFCDIERLDREKPPLYDFKIKMLINYILAEIKEKGKAVSENKAYTHPKVREAAAYALSHLGENLSLASISAKCGVSSAYFSALFHRVMGKSFKLWLTEIRIEYAKRLLEEGEENVLSVAYDCGYNTLSHFIEVFKNRVGITPKKYAEKYKKRKC